MGIRCLLVSANQCIDPFPVYPLGLAFLQGALKSRGHKVKIFDVLAQGGLAPLRETIKDFQPELVAISIRNVDSSDSNDQGPYYRQVEEVVKLIKSETSAPIVLGGPAFSLFPEEFMKRLKAEYGIVGEGETLICEIAEGLAKGAPLPGGLLKSFQESSTWVKPVFDKTLAKFYLRFGGMLNVQTKRGCSFKCAYCSYPKIEGHRYRFRDPEEVAEEVVWLHREIGAKYIFFADSVFNDPQGHYLKIAEALIKFKNQVPWCAFFRPKDLGREELRLLKASGLDAIEFGTDAATDETLEGLNKAFTFEDVIKVHEAALALDIPCAHYVIFGGPNETYETVKQGLKNLDYLQSTVVFAFAGIRILPGTEVQNRAIEEGLLELENPLFDPVFYFSPSITQTKLDQFLRNAWKNRLDRLYPCSKLSERIRILHKHGLVGPGWNFLVRRKSV